MYLELLKVVLQHVDQVILLSHLLGQPGQLHRRLGRRAAARTHTAHSPYSPDPEAAQAGEEAVRAQGESAAASGDDRRLQGAVLGLQLRLLSEEEKHSKRLVRDSRIQGECFHGSPGQTVLLNQLRMQTQHNNTYCSAWPRAVSGSTDRMPLLAASSFSFMSC